MGREIYALDLETAAKTKQHAAYAGLEPWRALHGTAFITSMSVCYPDTSVRSFHRRKMGDMAFEASIKDEIIGLEGKVVYAHNAVFDVAWLLASHKRSRMDRIPESIRRIKWFDTLLLAKWVINGQKTEMLNFSFALDNLVRVFLSKHHLTEEFVRMKGEKVDPGLDPYWERRNELDVIMTRELAVYFEDNLPPECRPGYIAEANNIVPVANSWIIGFRADQDRLAQVEQDYVKEQKRIIERIQIAPTVITSPKQLGHLLFDTLRLKPISRTPTGAPSSRSDDVKVIAYQQMQAGNFELGEMLNGVIRYKQLSVLRSKYIDGTKNALSHTGDGYLYGAPRIFGTYTGRFTYASKTLDTWQTGIAWHQIPRKAKEIRSFICPPEGYMVYEADASGQESRLMAIRSNDPTLIEIFNRGLNFHSMTASFIIGMDYEEFMTWYKSGDSKAVENRQLGKLTNLSCNYRIGPGSLSKKAFEEYDLLMTPDKAWFIINTFQRRYSRIPVYWDEAILFAKANGYTETFGGRRYKIHDWSSRRAWMSESSALMHPIQGGGAAMKNIAIAEIYNQLPDTDFALDLHDASFVWVPEDRAQDCKREIDRVLDEVDYSKYWGFDPSVKLPYESLMGSSFADVK